MNFSSCRLTVLLALIVGGMLSGCGSTNPSADSHTESGHRLVDLMRRMELLVHERELPAEAIMQMRSSQARVLRQIASEIAVRAPELRPELEAGRLELFRATASDLSDAADEVSTASRAGDTRRLDEALGRLRKVCQSCHQIFRFPGKS